MKYTFYIIYNVLYQIFSFWLLLLLGTYYNEVLVSGCLFWKSKKEREDLAAFVPVKIFTLIVEAIILVSIIYVINQLILSDTEEKSRRISIANRTAIIDLVASFIFLAICICGS
jgi:hypothetical protein